MKTIPLKTIEVLLDGKPTRISYGKQLIEIMRQPSDPRGADLEEVRKSMRVLGAIEKTEPATAPEFPILKLEDADFEHMKYKVIHARWPVIDQFVMQFIEDVTNPEAEK